MTLPLFQDQSPHPLFQDQSPLPLFQDQKFADEISKELSKLQIKQAPFEKTTMQQEIDMMSSFTFDRNGTSFRTSHVDSIERSIEESLGIAPKKEYSLFPELISEAKKIIDEGNGSIGSCAGGKDFSMFVANGYGEKRSWQNDFQVHRENKNSIPSDDQFYNFLADDDVQVGELKTLAYVRSMMIDPFGHHMCLRLLDVLDSKGRLLMFNAIGDDIVEMSCHFHGTRVVQKLLERIQGPHEVGIVTALFRDNVVELCKDLYGMHVIRKYMYHQDISFVDTISANIVNLSTHKYGCCVVQWCLDHVFSECWKVAGKNNQKPKLKPLEMQTIVVASISRNAMSLMNDAHGNYIVQKLFDISKFTTRSICHDVMVTLFQNIDKLAVQKYSSIVVEKCFIMADPDVRDMMVRELVLNYPHRLRKLLPDPFANYIIQKMMMLSKGETFRQLVFHIRQHFAALEITQLGKKIEFQMLVKFPILKPNFPGQMRNMACNLMHSNKMNPRQSKFSSNDWKKIQRVLNYGC